MIDRDVWGYCRYALQGAKNGNTPESDLIAVITRLDDVPQSAHRYEHEGGDRGTALGMQSQSAWIEQTQQEPEREMIRNDLPG